MILGIYSIRDRLSGYLQPTFDLNDAVAMRNFSAAILSPDAHLLMHTNSEDYDLYRVGQFDSDSGIISALPAPELVVSGNSVFRRSLGDKAGEYIV